MKLTFANMFILSATLSIFAIAISQLMYSIEYRRNDFYDMHSRYCRITYVSVFKESSFPNSPAKGYIAVFEANVSKTHTQELSWAGKGQSNSKDTEKDAIRFAEKKLVLGKTVRCYTDTDDRDTEVSTETGTVIIYKYPQKVYIDGDDNSQNIYLWEIIMGLTVAVIVIVHLIMWMEYKVHNERNMNITDHVSENRGTISRAIYRVMEERIQNTV